MAQRRARRDVAAEAVEKGGHRQPQDDPDVMARPTTGTRHISVHPFGHRPSQLNSGETTVEDVVSRIISLKVADGCHDFSRGRNGHIRTIPELKRGMEGMCQTIFASLGRQQSEGAYQRAFKVELELRGIAVQTEVKVSVTYRDVEIGSRRVDLLLTLEDGSTAIVEMKAVQTITKGSNLHAVHQLQYYLDAFDVEHGFLVNFPHDAGFPPPSNGDYVFLQEAICGVEKPLSDVRLRERKAGAVGDGPEVVYFQRVHRRVLR